jgi:lipopolysaccharide biosynthesis regulator YciM
MNLRLCWFRWCQLPLLWAGGLPAGIGARRSGAEVSELSSDYFRGLNYLLNEEQDKAIEVFLKLAEYNRDTVETHLRWAIFFAVAVKWIARSGCISIWCRDLACPMR